MKYQVNSARLLASTFGDRIAPNNTAPLHVIALNLDEAANLELGIKNAQMEFNGSGTDFANGRAALSEMHIVLGKELSKLLDGSVTIDPVEPVYKVIYDPSGKPIGHDTVAWIFLDGEPIEKTIQDSDPKIGIFACVYLSVME